MNENDQPLHDRQLIDDYASGLVDGVVMLEDVAEHLRIAVRSRADLFADQRRELQQSIVESTPTVVEQMIARAISTPVVPQRRRVLAYVGSLAAAAVVVAVVGIAVTRSGEPTAITESIASTQQAETRSAPEENAASMSMAPMAADSLGDEEVANVALLVIANLEELEKITRPWYQPDQAPLLAAVPQCADPLLPAVALEVIFDEQPVEIHFSVQDGVVVYRLDDCRVMAGIVP